MIHLYLMRHGKTLFNEKNIVQGWCDSLLTEASIQEATKLQERFASFQIHKVYASPTMRARQTAHCVVPSLPIKQKSQLMEINYGYLEGESAQTLALFYPNRYDFEHFEGFAGGESYHQAGPRFMQGMRDIVAKASEGEHILVVSHGAIMTWFLHQLDASITTKVPNLHYAHLTYDGEFHIEKDLDQ